MALVFDGHGSAQRAVERLLAADVPARVVEDGSLTPGVVAVTTGRLETGLVSDELQLAVLSEADLTGQRGSLKDTGRMPTKPPFGMRQSSMRSQVPLLYRCS